MSEYTHLVRLKPRGSYFFGGENYADEERKAFYFQESRDFPQQTSLLGLIRYQLLSQNGHLHWVEGREVIKNKGEASMLIGGKSFHPDPAQCLPNYGAIQRISPVFIEAFEEGTPYVPYFSPKIWEQQTNKYLPGSILESESPGKAFLMDDQGYDFMPSLRDFDPKLYLETCYRLIDANQEAWVCKDLIKKQEEQVGIFKSQTLAYRQHQNEDDMPPEQEGFFKMVYKKLDPSCSFSFYLKLDPVNSFESQELVVFGKEQSTFSMEVIPLEAQEETPFEAPLPQLAAGQTLWLLNNAKLDVQALYPFCEMVVGEDESFRCMQTEVSESYNYYGNPRKKGSSNQPTLSPRYNLMKRGSLIKLREDLSQDVLQNILPDILNGDANFQKIGYNHFLNL
jgi:CRISPR-associated protein Cmr3